MNDKTKNLRNTINKILAPLGLKLIRKYNTEDGNKVIIFLKSHNINCELIGSLKKRGHTEHDIDVWVKEPDTKENRDRILTLLNPTKMVNTDWGGMYCTTEIFGDVDIFFEEPT